MIALFQLIVVGFGVLTLIFIGVSLYSRRIRRGKLLRKWLDGPQRVDRDTFVRRGLKKYDGSVRRKLILAVYIVPVVLIALIIYLTNFN